MAESGREQLLDNKQECFSNLYGLDEDENDNVDDHGRKASIAALHKKDHSGTVAKHPRHAAQQGLGPATATTDIPRHSGSTSITKPPHLGNPTALPAQSSYRRVGLAQALTPATVLMKRRTFPEATPSSSAPPKLTGKRKREVELKLAPEDQQVFRGLHFFFFPNNDAHPARRLRIRKALEFGATWEQHWNESVTHVIVDKAIDYSLVLKFIKRDRIPKHVIIVNEVWPADCISYRSLLDHNATSYRALGFESSTRVRQSDDSLEASPRKSEKSLELKPAGQAVKTRQTQTPKTASSSSHFVETSETTDGEQVKAVSLSRFAEPAEELMPTSATTDEFEAAIKLARQMQHLPLDEEEQDSRPSSSNGPNTQTSDAVSAGTSKPVGKALAFQDKFQCMESHLGDKKEGPNSATIGILQQMADYYSKTGDEWRTRAYRKAVATLRNHPTKVSTKQEALALPNVGNRLAEKIEEIAYTNRLRRLDSVRAEPNDRTLQTFMGVYGAGFQQASLWVKQGYTTLDELLARADLSTNQRIGIEHYSDFNTRIPRAEVEKHGDIVRTQLLKIDTNFEVLVGGSYRRGAESSGDIDCIITIPNKPATYLRSAVFDELVPSLFRKGFLKASLAASSREDGSKWHGASCLSSSTTWRRIDFLLVPDYEMGAALIYFTGNDIFNRSLRLLASYKGMRLNQRGLYRDVIRGKGREKLTEGTLVEGKDERRIFQVLGVPWRPPQERIC